MSYKAEQRDMARNMAFRPCAAGILNRLLEYYGNMENTTGLSPNLLIRLAKAGFYEGEDTDAH